MQINLYIYHGGEKDTPEKLLIALHVQYYSIWNTLYMYVNEYGCIIILYLYLPMTVGFIKLTVVCVHWLHVVGLCCVTAV